MKLLIGMTGGIAAYKIASLVRLCTKSGIEVRVMMSKAACQFITPLTLQALSGNNIHTELLDPDAELGMGHIELARWADLLLIAPATANTIGKLANGLCDNLLTTVCLATSAPIAIAPAMNRQMWASAILQDNLAYLKSKGHHIITPDSGLQACGDIGMGRLPEACELMDFVGAFFGIDGVDDCHFNHLTTTNQTLLSNNKLRNKTIVITAGATIEAIDPVRFLSNHSTGKMGFAVTQACLDLGARVILICGKAVGLTTPKGAIRLEVGSADEMLALCLEHSKNADIFIGTAAVADFKVANIATQKIKKTIKDTFTLTLTKNPDILATIAKTYPNIVAVGFAAETHNIQEYAKIKLHQKNLAAIACNDVSDQSIGFGSDDNAMTVFFADKFAKAPKTLPKAPKSTIAKQLALCINEILDE